MSSIRDYLVPVVIPRRHKGALEVTSSWALTSPDVINPLNLLGFITGCSRMTCSLESLENRIQTDTSIQSLNNIDVDVSFNYHLDRATPQFETSAFQAACGFTVSRANKKEISSMYIKLPVLVRDIVTKIAELTFCVRSPKISYFEDLIDYVQKNAAIRIYPIMSSSDREALPGVIGLGKSVDDYIRILSRPELTKPLGSSGELIISMPEVYNSFNLEYKTIWSN